MTRFVDAHSPSASRTYPARPTTHTRQHSPSRHDYAFSFFKNRHSLSATELLLKFGASSTVPLRCLPTPTVCWCPSPNVAKRPSRTQGTDLFSPCSPCSNTGTCGFSWHPHQGIQQSANRGILTLLQKHYPAGSTTNLLIVQSVCELCGVHLIEEVVVCVGNWG